MTEARNNFSFYLFLFLPILDSLRLTTHRFYFFFFYFSICNVNMWINEKLWLSKQKFCVVVAVFHIQIIVVNKMKVWSFSHYTIEWFNVSNNISSSFFVLFFFCCCCWCPGVMQGRRQTFIDASRIAMLIFNNIKHFCKKENCFYLEADER